MSHLQKNLHKNRHYVSRPRFNATMECTPSIWSKYFETQKDVKISNNIFRVYTKGTSGPLLILLHGGGYSALTWALFTQEIVTRVECQAIAIDLRGHGSSITDDETNLALETLADDVHQIIVQMFTEEYPPCVIIGHSMGGAVAVEVGRSLVGLVGLCMIDVVEGTALESLSSMQSILRGRPASFRTIEQAIQWSCKGGQTHNLEAARVSMPGQIKSATTGQLASEEVEAAEGQVESLDPAAKLDPDDDVPQCASAINSIAEVDEEEAVNNFAALPPRSGGGMSVASLFKNPSPVDSMRYIWRIDLSKTERFWNGWFHGLSQKFLDIRAPKILILANIQVLDTTLTVGQMQGKFQMQVLSRSGHAIHEDQPEQVADMIAGFLVKQRIASSKDGFTPPLPGC